MARHWKHPLPERPPWGCPLVSREAIPRALTCRASRCSPWMPRPSRCAATLAKARGPIPPGTAIADAGIMKKTGSMARLWRAMEPAGRRRIERRLCQLRSSIVHSHQRVQHFRLWRRRITAGSAVPGSARYPPQCRWTAFGSPGGHRPPPDSRRHRWPFGSPGPSSRRGT